MSFLDKVIPPDQLQKEKWLIIGLTLFFSICVVFPFIIQISESGISLNFRFDSGIKVNIFAVQTGSLYALLAIGFSLIYGVAKQLKLSLGGYFVIGAYCQFFLLETMEIIPEFRTDFDGLMFLGLVLLPLVLILILLVLTFTLFSFRDYLFVLMAPIISGGGIILIDGNLVAGFYVGLASIIIGLTGWYLELPKREIALGSFIYALSMPALYIIGFPSIYFSLMLLSVIFTACVAMISDRYFLDTVRHSHISVMIVTFALALVFQSFVQIVYFPQNGKDFTRFQSVDWSFPGIVPKTGITTFFGISIPTIRLISLVFSIIAVILLYTFIYYTKFGIALRAVSQDEEAAALVGINIRKTTAIVSGVGMGLAGFAAVLTSTFSARPLWNPFMGWAVLIWAIAVVTLGGMGSLGGSIIAAFIIGYSEILVSTIDPSYSIAIPFLIVILVMIVKPEGLFGDKKEIE
ncbi:MAG: branched-chain amino acid ABC transporter permease [Candidatus Hodarchaeales archaeon]|jgi:branched-chain amino acid transport system permease protein